MGEETCDVVKGGSDGELFDCNICLEMVKDPVVTCCGHLFCWSCLYRWMQSNTNNTSKECPVCKGKITIESLIPINGRGRGGDRGGNNNNHIHEDGEESTLKIPPRPTARHVSEEEEDQDEEDEDEDFPMSVRERLRQSRTRRRIAIIERMIQQHHAVQIDSRVVSDDVDG